MAMEWAAEGDATRLTWRTRFESDEEAERLRDFWDTANQENFDRLASLLAADR
jgi:hypothetical protein